MCERTQLHWIAEAEARRLEEAAFRQRALLDPPLSVILAQPANSLWREWMLRTMSRRSTHPAASQLQSGDASAADNFHRHAKPHCRKP